MESREGCSRNRNGSEDGSSPSGGYGTPPATTSTPRKIIDPRDDSDNWNSDSEAGSDEPPRRWGHAEPMVCSDPLRAVVGTPEKRPKSKFMIGTSEEPSSNAEDLREMFSESARTEHPLMQSGDDDHIVVAASDLRRFFGPQFFPTADEQYVFDQTQRRNKPKIVNGYMFGSVLGSGMYSKVKEVVDCVTLSRRALKIMKYRRLRKIPNGMENVKREIEIMRILNHENVVKLYDVFLKFHFDTEQQDVQQQKVYMVLEFCVGNVQTLVEREKRFAFGEAHVVFVQVVKGLEYLHSNRVIHKDIKPANLLYDTNFVIKICDFGVAEQLDLFNAEGLCRAVQGTPKFQAPELVSGNSTHFIGYKADVWSLGVTLFNLVTGSYPFDGAALLALFDAISHQELEFPSDIDFPTDCTILLQAMLAKDPVERFDIPQIQASSWYRRQYIEDKGGGRMNRFKEGSQPMSIREDLAEYYFERVGSHPEELGIPINAADLALLNYVGDEGAEERARAYRKARKRRNRRSGLFSCFRRNRSPSR